MGTTPHPARIPMRFEVALLPVADVDRAKAFYEGLGWRLDIDFTPAPGMRGVQLTPPGSAASIHIGDGLTTMAPGSLEGLLLAVGDIEEAREDLVGRGVEVGEIWHLDPREGPRPGRDPERSSYRSRAAFTDPDGNGWQLQEVTERHPGRTWATDIAARADVLREAARRHEAFATDAPPHDPWDWYAAYVDAREDGRGPEEASAAAARHIAEATGTAASG